MIRCSSYIYDPQCLTEVSNTANSIFSEGSSYCSSYPEEIHDKLIILLLYEQDLVLEHCCAECSLSAARLAAGIASLAGEEDLAHGERGAEVEKAKLDEEQVWGLHLSLCGIQGGN
jgi:hypothetical protein